MKIGPDGSLCRITSSYKEGIVNVGIIEVPDAIPSFRIAIARPPGYKQESSEDSDSPITDDDLSDIKFPSASTVGNVEENTGKVDDSKTEKPEKPNETVSKKEVKESNQYNTHRRPPRKNNRYFRPRRGFHSIPKNYKSLQDMEEIYNYGNRDFNSAINQEKDFNSAVNRDFNSAASHNPTYNQRSSDNLSPWITPPTMIPNYTCTSFTLASAPGPAPENPRNSFGLLGDHPSYPPIHQNSTYTPMSSNFASNNQSNSFVRNQNSSYSQMTSNYSSGRKTGQNYWKGRHGNQYRNKYSNNRKPNAWNRGPGRHPNERNSLPGNNKSFDYRN